MFRLLSIAALLGAAMATAPAAVACELGPDARSAAALHAAVEAQRAVADQLAYVAEDRESRRFYEGLDAEGYAARQFHGQASIFLDISGVTGFRVCDDLALVPAKLDRQQLGVGAGIGFRDIARFDARLFGVSDSVVQTNLDPYAPPREEGQVATVPGAGGLGQGMWALRLELFELFAASVGRVRNQSIAHRIGWETEFDDEGNEIGLERYETTHWTGQKGADDARWFVTVGAPEWATTELVIGGGRLEGLGLASGRYGLWQSGLDIQGAARWDGIIGQPLAEVELGTEPFEAVPGLRLSARSATELARPRIRELSARVRYARWLRELLELDLPADLEMFAVQTRVGVSGGERLAEGLDTALVPGIDAELSVAVPIYAIIRVGGFMGINRPETLAMIPNAAGRPEWGATVYTTYAF